MDSWELELLHNDGASDAIGGLVTELANPPSAIRNPQFKTLMMPGGIGSTHKVLILGKGVGAPALRGCSFKVRVT